MAPTEDGFAVLELNQEISFGRSVALRVGFSQGVGLIAATTLLEKSGIARDRVAQFPENEQPEIALCTQDRCIRAHAVRPWARQESNTSTAFQVIATVSASELKEISKASRLTISDNFGNAISDVSLSAELSTEGLASGVALLLRQR